VECPSLYADWCWLIGPVQSRCHEGSPVGKRSLRWEGFVEKVGFYTCLGCEKIERKYGQPFSQGLIRRRWYEKMRFSTNFSLYLENDARYGQSYNERCNSYAIYRIHHSKRSWMTLEYISRGAPLLDVEHLRNRRDTCLQCNANSNLEVPYYSTV